jgi:prepilin signal peptidase PulO-like enzyme (type II secretory pathway)
MWILFILFWYFCIIIAGSIITIIFRLTLPNHIKKTRTIDDCFCDYCGKPSRPKRYANLPIINYFILHGITKCCNKRLSPLNPIAEFSLGTLIFVLIAGWI